MLPGLAKRLMPARSITMPYNFLGCTSALRKTSENSIMSSCRARVARTTPRFVIREEKQHQHASLRIRSPDHQIIRSADHQIIRSSDHQIIRSSDHQIIRSSDHQIIRSSDHQIIRSSHHRIIVAVIVRCETMPTGASKIPKTAGTGIT